MKSKIFGWGIIIGLLWSASLPVMAIESETVEGKLNSTSETLTDGSFYNIHSFEGRAGESVFIELISEQFNAVIILLDPEGNRIAQNDDGGAGNNAQIAIILPTTGTYRILANSYEQDEVGSYKLSWRDASGSEVKKTQADELLQQGNQKFRVSQFKEALASWSQSLKLYRELGNRRGEAVSLNNLGNAYDTLGEYEKAIDFHQQSLAIDREIGNRLGEANSLGNLGNAYFYLGKYEKAIDFHQQSLAIDREIGNRLGEANSLGNLGIAYDTLGEYEKAIDFHQQSLAIKREIGNRLGEANSLGSLGNAYISLGEYEKAIDFYQQSLAISREIGNRLGEANSLGSLGNAYNNLGEYEKAIDFYQQALAIDREISDRLGEANSLGSLGNAYNNLGEYEKAIDFHQQSLAIKREIGDRLGEANSLGNLGNAYDNLGEYEKAIEFYQQSLAISREIDNLLGEAVSLNNLGNAYISLGEYEKAIDFYQQSLAISREIGNRRGEADALGNLGNAYNNLGEYEKAIDFYQQALAIDREIGNREGEGITLSNIGRLFESQEQKTLAIVFYKESVNIREGIRSDNLSLPRELQESYTATIAGTYRSLADLLLSQGRILEAQQVLELLKIQEIRDYTRNRDAGSATDDVILLLEEEEILVQYKSLIQFSQELENCATKCAEEKKKALEKQHNDLFIAYKDAIIKLKETVQGGSEVLDPNDFSSVEFQDIVNNKPRTVLVYPFVTKERLWLLFATKQAVFTVREITNADLGKISEAAKELRENLEKTDSTSLEEIKRVGKQLYDWLIEPIEQELETGKIKHLVFSLDSAIRYIPMGVLYDGEEFLIQKYDITTILSAQLTNFTGSLPADADDTPILGLGLSEAKGGFEALPHVETELDKIVKEEDSDDPKGLFPGKRFLNEDFHWDNLLNNVRGRIILHIATHGKFSPTRQEDSYLVLGTGERLPVSQLAILQKNYLRDTHLVVLSACETGLSNNIGSGTEISQTGLSNNIGSGAEINSISYYFLSGGAESVLASLWKVNDESTSELMQRFYSYLVTEPGITKAQALQKAQSSFLKESQFSHPHYWAPFTLLGNGL